MTLADAPMNATDAELVLARNLALADSIVRDAAPLSGRDAELSTHMEMMASSRSLRASQQARTAALAFRARNPKLDPSSTTLSALVQTFRRTAGGGRAVTPRRGRYLPVLTRSAAAELKTIAALSRRPDVVRIAAVPSSPRGRTPDLIVHMRGKDGSVRPTRMEIRALTGARRDLSSGVPRNYLQRGTGGARTSTAADIVAAIMDKALPHGKPSQLAAPRPDVPPGGILAIHLPHGGTGALTSIRAAMARASPVLQLAPYVHAIEFYPPSGRSPITYRPNRRGTYVRVRRQP